MRHNGREGNAATIAFSMVAFLGCSAMVVDIGYLYAIQTDLQAATDAAALAGVGYFDGTAEGIDDAKAEAVAWGARNSLMGDQLCSLGTGTECLLTTRTS